jgi:2-oxoisovalerate dehydrogenase E1 component
MVTARLTDDAEVRLKQQGRTYFQISCAGHEAVQAAAALLLRPGEDWFYPYYRDRALAIGLGVTPRDMLLQAFGKAADPSSGGREMPCHFGSPELHIVNQSSPTGTQFLQAVGTAEAGQIARQHLSLSPAPAIEAALPHSGGDELVYVSAGEGATSEGEFYEAVCAALLKRLPVLFLIQDNSYAISVPVEAQTPGGNLSSLLRSFPGLHIEEVDGLSVVESYRGLRRAVAYCRSGQGPSLVHAHAIRLRPHSNSDDDRLYRPKAEKEADVARDPLPAFEEFLIQEGLASPEELRSVREEARNEVARAVDSAALEPDPDPEAVTRFVYNPEIAIREETVPRAAGPALTVVDSINRALECEMARDPRIVVFGEDVADLSRTEYLCEVKGKGGVFKVTYGLQRKFGEHRVFNTPIAEAGIVGRALGMAVRGLRPVVEIQFFDYIWPAMHQIRNELSLLRWRSNNGFSAPVVMRVPIGGYLTGGAVYHSQSSETIFCRCPGLRVVLPSNARDAAGLLRTAIRCGDPVLFLEHKHLYRQGYARSPDPGPDYVIPFGKAAVVRSGRDLTVVTYGALVEKTRQAAEKLATEGKEAEVIDLRSLSPYDWDAVAASVERTGRLAVVHEEPLTFGFGAELAARAALELFEHLDAPIARLGSKDAHVGYSPVLEQATLPQAPEILELLRRTARY